MCAEGYIQRANGVCILTPAVCYGGEKSDGNGNCIPISVQTVCANGYKSDGNGDCVLIATKTEGPEPFSTE